MGHLFVAAGAVYAALAVAAGAFGAHTLAGRLDPRSLELWESAARYLMYGGLGLVACGVLERLWAERLLIAAGWCLALGAPVFSLSVFALALGGPQIFGAVTPVGGLLLIAGFAVIAWAAIDRHLEAGEEAEEVPRVEEPAEP